MTYVYHYCASISALVLHGRTAHIDGLIDTSKPLITSAALEKVRSAIAEEATRSIKELNDSEIGPRNVAIASLTLLHVEKKSTAQRDAEEKEELDREMSDTVG